MPDLENPQRRAATRRGTNRRFELRAGVAGQQQLDVAEAHAQHDRVLVARPSAAPTPARGGCTTSIATPPSSRRSPCAQLPPGDPAARAAAPSARSSRVSRHGHAFPDLARPQIVAHTPARRRCGRRRGCVNASQSSRRTPSAQSAGVTTRPPMSNAPPAPPVSTSSVWPARQLQSDRVALPDIQHRQPQPRRGRPAGARQGRDDDDDQDRAGRDRAAIAPPPRPVVAQRRGRPTPRSTPTVHAIDARRHAPRQPRRASSSAVDPTSARAPASTIAAACDAAPRPPDVRSATMTKPADLDDRHRRNRDEVQAEPGDARRARTPPPRSAAARSPRPASRRTGRARRQRTPADRMRRVRAHDSASHSARAAERSEQRRPRR